MHKELLTHSPLLALPLAALLIFLGVFLFVVFRALAKGAHEYAGEAALPLQADREENDHELR